MGILASEEEGDREEEEDEEFLEGEESAGGAAAPGWIASVSATPFLPSGLNTRLPAKSGTCGK